MGLSSLGPFVTLLSRERVRPRKKRDNIRLAKLECASSAKRKECYLKESIAYLNRDNYPT